MKSSWMGSLLVACLLVALGALAGRAFAPNANRSDEQNVERHSDTIIVAGNLPKEIDPLDDVFPQPDSAVPMTRSSRPRSQSRRLFKKGSPVRGFAERMSSDAEIVEMSQFRGKRKPMPQTDGLRLPSGLPFPDFSRRKKNVLRKPAGESRSRKSTPMPGRLSGPPDAAPITRTPLRQQTRLSEMIRQIFPRITAEEIEVWERRLKNQPVATARGILELQRDYGSVVRPYFAPQNHLHGDSFPDARGQLPQRTGTPAKSAGSSPLAKFPPAKFPSANSPLADPSFSEFSLAASCRALEQAGRIILNNIANVQTPGFKRSRPLLVNRQAAAANGLRTRTGQRLPVGDGTRLAGVQTDMKNGRIRRTGMPFDLAIVGRGFFQFVNGTSIYYSRCGRLSLDANGDFVLHLGGKPYKLEPAISVAPGTTGISISDDGVIHATHPPLSESMKIGRIQLVRFINPGGLVSQGDTLFAASVSSGLPEIENPGREGYGTLRQGFLESANVDLKREMKELQELTRTLRTLKQAAQLIAEPPRSHVGPSARGPVLKRTSLLRSPQKPRWAENSEPQQLQEALQKFHRNDKDPDPWWGKYFMSPKAREIERNLGITHNESILGVLLGWIW